MEMQFMVSPYASTPHFTGTKITTSNWGRCQRKQQSVYYLKAEIVCGHGLQQHDLSRKLKFKFLVPKISKNTEQLTKVAPNGPETKGTVIGAVALIIGTSIGSGMLALPKRTSPAGFVPSAISMIICWGFLLVEALLLAEINVGLMKKKGKMREKKEEKDGLELEFISIRSMAQETLGEWGGSLATINYIFLAYASMAAYTSKSGEILSPLIHLPTSIAGVFFAIASTSLIAVGGTCLTDRVNQWMTATMIGLLIVIEAIGATAGVWSGLAATSDWGRVPVTIPVIIFSLVYHDIAPVICSYLGGDLNRIRLSFVIGSIVPLLALLMWDAVALGLSSSLDGADPLDLLTRLGSGEMSAMVEAFSLLAVATSLISTILGFSQFLIEQLNKLSNNLPIETPQKEMRPESLLIQLRDWWRTNKLNLTATTLVIAPPLLVSNSVPDAFSTATDIAGGYCMAILYGVLPPAMAWCMNNNNTSGQDEEGEEKSGSTLLGCKPALVVAGLFACGIVLEQVLQDISLLHV